MPEQTANQYRVARRVSLRMGAVLCLSVSAQTSFAQDNGGFAANLSVAQGIELSDDEDSGLRTELDFGLISQTRSQSFAFNLSGGIEERFEDGLTIDADAPRADLSYSIENRQSVLSANLSYRQSDTDNLTESLDDPETLILDDDGIRENTSIGLGYEFGREARFGGTINLGASRTAYTNLSASARTDQDRLNGTANFSFEIDPQITATLGYSYIDIDRETGRDVQDQSINAGANFLITPTLNATATLGFSRVEDTDAGITTVEEGLNYGFSIAKTRPASVLRASLSSDLNENGRRTNVLVGGNFETRRGELSLDLGLTDSDTGTLNPLVRFGYAEDLKTGRYSIAIDQTFDTTDDGNDTLNSRLRLTWQQDLNRTARFGTNFTYQITDVFGADDDVTSWQIGASFSRDLTRDFALTARYTYSLVDEDGLDRDEENVLFIGLETSFAWRP